MARDMTQKQFDAALAKHGMARTGLLGYVVVFKGCTLGSRVSVHPGNAGKNRRRQLAYLLREQDRCEAEYSAHMKEGHE